MELHLENGWEENLVSALLLHSYGFDRWCLFFNLSECQKFQIKSQNGSSSHQLKFIDVMVIIMIAKWKISSPPMYKTIQSVRLWLVKSMLKN